MGLIAKKAYTVVHACGDGGRLYAQTEKKGYVP
jgi:hypothetical protein